MTPASQTIIDRDGVCQRSALSLAWTKRNYYLTIGRSTRTCRFKTEAEHFGTARLLFSLEAAIANISTSNESHASPILSTSRISDPGHSFVQIERLSEKDVRHNKREESRASQVYTQGYASYVRGTIFSVFGNDTLIHGAIARMTAETVLMKLAWRRPYVATTLTWRSTRSRIVS